MDSDRLMFILDWGWAGLGAIGLYSLEKID